MAAEAPAAPPPSAPSAPQPNLAPPSEGRSNVPGEPAGAHADALGDAFSQMERDFGGGTDTPPETAPDRTPPPKPDAPAKPEPTAKPGEPQRGPDGKFLPKKDEPPKPEPAKPAEPSVDKMAPKQLREAYEALRKKHAALEEERKKAPAPTPPEPQADPEKQQLTERLTEREKRIQGLEEKLRFTAYQESDEYKEKYEQPFVSAWKAGQDRAARLKVPEQKNEMEEVVSAARQGTPEDFNTLMLIQDDNEAAAWAHKTFGSNAPYLLSHRMRVEEANAAKHQALEQFKTQGAEREKQQAALTENQTKAVRQLYHKFKDSAAEKYPQWFKPDEADPKTKTLLEKGMRLADRWMGAPDVEGEKPMTGEERIKLMAAVRNMAGGFQNVAYQLQKERARRTELEAKLADYEKSEPKGGDGRAGGSARPQEGGESPEQAFDSFFGRT